MSEESGIRDEKDSTYTETAEEEKKERLPEAGDSHDPEETDEHRDTEDVLDGRQVDSQHDS